MSKVQLTSTMINLARQKKKMALKVAPFRLTIVFCRHSVWSLGSIFAAVLSTLPPERIKPEHKPALVDETVKKEKKKDKIEEGRHKWAVIACLYRLLCPRRQTATGKHVTPSGILLLLPTCQTVHIQFALCAQQVNGKGSAVLPFSVTSSWSAPPTEPWSDKLASVSGKTAG